MSKFMIRTVPLLLILLFGGVTLAKAQGVSAYFGFGAATDKSNGVLLDTLGDVGPKMTGAFGIFGADFMWKPQLGFGGEYSWRLAQGSFAPNTGVNYRPAFYDFNAIWHPVGKNARVVPEFQGGLGGVNMKFYLTQQFCALNATACTTLNQYFASSNHFQLHFSGGVRLYVKGNIYLRPQVDLHWVHNFNEFGSNLVPEYSVVIGYTFGQR